MGKKRSKNRASAAINPTKRKRERERERALGNGYLTSQLLLQDRITKVPGKIRVTAARTGGGGPGEQALGSVST